MSSCLIVRLRLPRTNKSIFRIFKRITCHHRRRNLPLPLYLFGKPNIFVDRFMNGKKKGNKDIGCAVSAAWWFLTTQVSKREFIIVRLSAGERAMMIQLETTVLCAIEHRNG